MPATRDGKLWRSQFYYKDWQGVHISECIWAVCSTK